MMFGRILGVKSHFELINQMTTSQTRLRTSPIAALVNRVVPLTFTLDHLVTNVTPKLDISGQCRAGI
jgi:hypothetical protein